MNEFSTIDGFRKALDDYRTSGASIGFVPTMGALHEGHLSLASRAAAECDVAAMSIFVNPLQFGAGEDLHRYPRSLGSDREFASTAGVSCLFVPEVSEMYPNGSLSTTVSVAGITETLEGALRPGHFDGVATVVAKLFSIVGHCRAYFGEKDWQQLNVVTNMAADLSFPIEIVPCEIVREDDGLALSSRNDFLNEQERLAALCLSSALFGAQELVDVGERSASALLAYMRGVIGVQPLVAVSYAEAVDESLRPVDKVDAHTRLLVAAEVGSTHLIDNIGVRL